MRAVPSAFLSLAQRSLLLYKIEKRAMIVPLAMKRVPTNTTMLGLSAASII
jgi:hypothetical protein